jgi:hypothetical protein
MKNLVNHKGFQLRDDAADSLARYEHDHGVITIDSAYRSQAEQDKLIYKYAHPQSKYDKPPYLYQPARISKHTAGTAIDTPNAKARAVSMAAYGWRFLFEYDKVHLEYNPALDTRKAATKPSQSPLVLRKGSRGSAVVALQRKLRDNYPLYAGKLVPDGVYGNATVAAVKEFQRRAGIKSDGIAGPVTRARLGV